MKCVPYSRNRPTPAESNTCAELPPGRGRGGGGGLQQTKVPPRAPHIAQNLGLERLGRRELLLLAQPHQKTDLNRLSRQLDRGRSIEQVRFNGETRALKRRPRA